MHHEGDPSSATVGFELAALLRASSQGQPVPLDDLMSALGRMIDAPAETALDALALATAARQLITYVAGDTANDDCGPSAAVALQALNGVVGVLERLSSVPSSAFTNESAARN